MIPSFRLTRLVALVAALLLPALPVHAEDARLIVLHTTDLHGTFDGWDYGRDQPGEGGLPRIATLVRRARAEGSPVLLLDAGDAVQGGAASLFAREGGDRANPVIAAMNASGYDAMAVGNHEFDYGRETLERLRGEARFPWLAANVVREDGRPAFDGSAIRTVGGIKVGIVGVCTPAVPNLSDSSRWAGLRFLDPVEPASREVERLRRNDHCDVVVLVAHSGLERDGSRSTGVREENWGRRLAEQVRGVDVVILGHTHEVVASRKFGGTIVTQAGRNGTSLGRIEIPLSRASGEAPWTVGEVQARVIAVSDTVTPDAEVLAAVQRDRALAREALGTIVGATARPLAAPAGRASDSGLWELIHRAQLRAGGAEVSLAALPDPSIEIAPGPIRRRDLLRLYPYENTLVTIELTGAQLERVLEHSATALETYGFSAERPLFRAEFPGYNFDMAAGVEYTVDPTRAPGDRIQDLRFEGAPLDPARRLRVALNSYRANGGGGFPEVVAAPRLARSERTVREAIEALLLEHPSHDAPSLPGWRLRPAFAAGPERAAIHRLVRNGVLPADEVMALDTVRIATRGQFRAWLNRAMGPKFAPLGGRPEPDDARPIQLGVALEACEKVARAARYALASRGPDPAFRHSLLSGTSLATPTPDGIPLAAALSPTQALAVVSNLRFPTIRVLETTDFHGAILQTGRERGSNRPVGGSSVLAAWIERLRAENPQGTVLLDGGDWYQGTMISNLQFGRPVIEQMNALGYAAAAIGNHEFDWNADTLQRRVAELKCAALGANMVEVKTGRRPRWARADTVFSRRGMNVGVLGLCYRNTPSVTLGKYVAHLRFENDSVTAARLAPELDRRSDVMIAVGHVPAEFDSARGVRGDLPRLARIPGFDLVLGGHSHNQVLHRVGDVPVMISGSHGSVVGVCDLVVDGIARKVIERNAWLQPTWHDAIEPDSAMAGRIERWNENVAPIAGQFLCRNARRLGRDRGVDSDLGNLVSDAMRAEVQADVALQNSGGLRADLPAGDVTRGSIYEVMPFDNTLVTMRLTGDELRQVIEEGLSFGRVPQLSGLRITYNLELPRGNRLITLAEPSGQPVDRTFRYRVVVNNFMAGGGDNYESLQRGRDLEDTGINVRDALERYVLAQANANGGTLDFRSERRIVRRGSSAPREPDR